jgi:hypothetical protein
VKRGHTFLHCPSTSPRYYDRPDGSGRAACWKSLWEDSGIRSPAYSHISIGDCRRLATNSLPTLINVPLTSPQLVHQFFKKYEPQSPGICAFLLLVVPAVVSGVFVRGASSILGPLFRAYAIFHTFLILSVVFYRLSPFHPLARYPGPTLAKVSKLWFVGINRSMLGCLVLMIHPFKAYLGWQGKQHVHYRNLHKKYGDVVRVGTSSSTLGTRSRLNPNTTSGPNEIMLSDVSVIAPLLGPGGWGKGSCM